MINTNDLDKKAIALGKLMGLLADEDSLSVNTDWFGDPVGAIGSVGNRLDHLVWLIGSLLGPGIDNPPNVITDAAWYPIPDPVDSDTTAFHLVMPKSSPKRGEIGFGMLHTIPIANLTITAYIYVPLFSYSPNGTELIVKSADHPMRFGLQAITSTSFEVSEVTFTAMTIEALIYLSGAAPTFRMEFVDLKGTTKPAVYTHLADLLDPTVSAWIGEVMVQGSYWLNLYLGSSASTVGDILVAAHFLTQDDAGAYHLSLRNLTGSATEIALNFLFAGLDALSKLEIPLVTLPGGGIFIRHRESSGDYGIRVAAQLELPSSVDQNGKASPAVDVSLGAWMADESETSNWISRITGDSTFRPGLSIYALRRDADGRLSFAPGFEITSVGVDIQGGGDAPLFNINGYTLRGAEIRTYLSSEGWPFGFAIRLDQIGIPLAEDFTSVQSGGGGNPVASSLIASGNQQGSSTEATSTTNPVFSGEAGYVHGYDPLLEIYDPDGNKTDVIWFPIQRRFGPVECKKVGVKIKTDNKSDPVLGLIFDGNVALGPLDIYLDQLSVDAHLKKIANISGYGLDLQGIDVSLDTGGVEISGGLLRSVTSDGSISYDGEAMLKYKEITLAAFGSYGTLPHNGGTTMFIFAMLNRPIGGPAFFYVTGLSAGFGYNRALTLPTVENVRNFPLVAGLSDPSSIGGDDPTPGQALAKLGQWVPPSRGDYWLAAGVQFTTFEIIKSNALLVVQFGNELIISVLGVSTLKQPQAGNSYVYAELGIVISFRPEKGELQASAQLAPSSFVMTPKARLTGGFAFYAWFDNNRDHPGDFVFTIGGYHPGFAVPDHYPKVPRVGINWPISDSLSIVGGAYFAITPSAMMAGGSLQITYSSGPLKAWLKAQADVILFWNPFYLIADVSVSVGVSCRIHVLFVDVTISAEIGATFHLYGPPIGGSVHVDWYIISFTINFGADPKTPNELTWDQFKGMLPHKTEKARTQAPRPMRTGAMAAVENAATRAASSFAGAAEGVMQNLSGGFAPHPASNSGGLTNDPQPTTTPAFLNITGNRGPQEVRQIEGLTFWLVRPANFRFTAGSAVPATTITVRSQHGADDKTIAGNAVGMRKVNGGIPARNYRSTQTITILRHDGVADIKRCMATDCSANPPAGCTATPIDITGWQIDAVQKNLPQALWGETSGSGSPANGDQTIAGTVGVVMEPKPRAITNCTPRMVIDETFADRVINPNDMYRLSISRSVTPANVWPQPARTFADIARINDPAAAGKRGTLFAALQSLGVNGWSNDPLPKMALDPGLAFADEPLAGSPFPPRPNQGGAR